MMSKLSEADFGALFAPPETRLVATNSGDVGLVNPIDGQVIDKTNVDHLIEAYAFSKEVEGHLKTWLIQLRDAIAAHCEGGQKTQRVRGRTKKAKVTFPGPSWDQSVLKEAWHSYPALRDELLTLASLRVKAREFKKAEATSGPVDYRAFVEMIASAERPPTASPTVTVEGEIES